MSGATPIPVISTRTFAAGLAPVVAGQRDGLSDVIKPQTASESQQSVLHVKLEASFDSQGDSQHTVWREQSQLLSHKRIADLGHDDWVQVQASSRAGSYRHVMASLVLHLNKATATAATTTGGPLILPALLQGSSVWLQGDGDDDHV